MNADNARASIVVKKLDFKYFDIIRKMLYNHYGIEMNDSKQTLMESRLNKLLRVKKINSYADYITYLKNDKTGQAMVELTSHLTTNHTHFNREPVHFDFFKKTALPEHGRIESEKGKRDLRIWCAGCSSGEESYMLAMLIHQYVKDQPGNWERTLLATDLSTKVLEIASKGEYTEERLSDLPAPLRSTYFKKIASEVYQANPVIRNHITFRRFNLMNAFPFKNKFQVIFCRNVMIYFDNPTKNKLVERFHDSLVPGGYLFVGHSESFRSQVKLKFVMPGVYKKGI